MFTKYFIIKLHAMYPTKIKEVKTVSVVQEVINRTWMKPARKFAFKQISWPKHAMNILFRFKYMYLTLPKIFVACFGHEFLKAKILPM